jgi:hypothetical protein
MNSWHPLHFLAQNLPVESAVLENPTWKRFQREVDRGGYDVVAITFTLSFAKKLLDMVTWLRAAHPEIEIIIGGYGTALFSEAYGIEEEIRSKVNAICFGEGLAFMRDYLAKRWGVATVLPMRQELVPTKASLFRTHLPVYRQLNFVKSLGCWNSCSFCATSSHFGHKKVEVASMQELYEAIRQMSAKYPSIQSAVVYDENFLDKREQVLELSRLLEQDKRLHARPLCLTVFSSVSTIAKYSVEELLRCCIGTIFVGVESFCGDIISNEALGKRRGEDVAALFERLHQSGINTIGSMVIGWDGHDKENVHAEMEKFVALNPTLYQVVPLHAIPGTPLWQKLKRERRIIEDYKYEEDGVCNGNFRYQSFTHREIEGEVFTTYARLVEEGGPWPFRIFANLLAGYHTLSQSDDELLRLRAQGFGKMMRVSFPLAFASGLVFFGRAFRARWRRAMALYARVSPSWFVCGALLGAVALPLMALYSLSGIAMFHLRRDGDQPDTIYRTYPSVAAS